MKEQKENEEKNEEDNNNNSKHKSSTKDINFNQKYKLSKHADILKFLLHRDKFLHISAVGSKQEMHNYMRQELEKLRNAKYDNPYSQEIINNLHYESQSIAYYVDDWKFLYYLKMFPDKKVYEIPVNLQRESLEKYSKIIQKCKAENNDEIKDDNDIQEEDNNNDVEMNENGSSRNDDMNNIERKRKNMNDNNHTDKPSVIESANKTNNNDQKSPRKKRKTLERKPKHDNGYNTAQLCMDQEYLTYDQKLALYKAFEFTTLIESVWNLSRKSFITAFINIELDLPSMSGLQSCVELGWSVLGQFKDIPDDLDTDFDETLSLYKDFNKEKQVRSRAPFAGAGALLAHHNAANSDDDAPIQNGLGLTSINAGFKWEDYDTLDDDSSSDEDDNGVVVDPIPDNDRRMKNRELPHVPLAVRSGTGSYMAWDPMTVVTQISQSGGNKNDSDDEKKQKKGRFRVSDDGDDDKEDKQNSKSNESKDNEMDQDQDDEEKKENGPQEAAYGEYDEVGDDLRAKEEVRDSNNYIGYINRKEFKLDMKKRRIIRRSKTKEYKDRIDKYGTCDFLYTQIKDYIDPPNKKKRSKHKYVQNIS